MLSLLLDYEHRKKDYDQQDDQPVQYSITYDSILIHTGTFHPGTRMFIAFDRIYLSFHFIF